MKNKLERAERMVRVLGQMHRREDLRMVEFKQALAEKEAEELRYVAALGECVTGDARMSRSISKGLMRASTDIQATKTMIEKQAQVCLASGRKVKQAATRLGGVEREWANLQATKELAEIIERSVQRSDSSVGQGGGDSLGSAGPTTLDEHD